MIEANNPLILLDESVLFKFLSIIVLSVRLTDALVRGKGDKFNF
jgi:hypothetical protein